MRNIPFVELHVFEPCPFFFIHGTRGLVCCARLIATSQQKQPITLQHDSSLAVDMHTSMCCQLCVPSALAFALLC
jgi:hypothetical protein